MEFEKHLTRHWYLFLLLTGFFSFLLFFPTLFFGLLNYDDPWLVSNNMHLKHFSWESLMKIWFDLSPEQRLQLGAEYLPMRDLSVILDAILFRNWIGGFHLTNILLYALFCGLFTHVVFTWSKNTILAFLSGILFSSHPLHVESVAWLSERKGLLAGVFVMLAALIFRRFLMRPRTLTFIATALTLVCAIWSKAIGLTGVAFLAALCWFFPNQASDDQNPVQPDNRPSPAQPGHDQRHLTLKNNKLIWIGLGALLLISLLAFIPVWLVGKQLVVNPAYHGGGFWGSIWVSALAQALYFKHFLLLAPLGIAYAIPANSVKTLLLGTGGMIVSLALLFVALKTVSYHKKGSLLGFSAVAYWIFFLPVCQFIVPLQNIMADRYYFLPSAALCILFSLLILHLSHKKLAYVLFSLFFLFSAFFTCKQTTTWASSEKLYLQALKAHPRNVSAMIQLSQLHLAQGQFQRSWQWLDQASRIRPQDSDVLMHQGLFFEKRGQAEKAIDYMTRAANADPRNYTTRANLALLLLRREKKEEALQWARQAARLHPFKAHNQRTLGLAALANNALSEASTAFKQAMLLEPQNPTNLYNMAVIELRFGNRNQAVYWLKETLKLAPQHRLSQNLLRQINLI